MMKRNLIILTLVMIFAMVMVVAPVAANDDPPVVTDVSPTTGQNTTIELWVNLTGTGFNPLIDLSGVNLTWAGSGVQPNITAKRFTNDTISTMINCTFDLTGRIAGDWFVNVTNPDGQTGGWSAFTIQNVTPPPTITAITPATGQNTTTALKLNLTGTWFNVGTTAVAVNLTKAGQTNISASSLTSSSTMINCTFDLTGRIAGDWFVNVTNADGQTGGWSAFTIQNVTPVPTFQSAATNTAGTIITITFSKVMANPAGNESRFKYQIGGGTDQSFSAAALNSDNTKIDLTTSGTAIAYGNTVTVNYTAGTVTAADSTVLASFGPNTTTNNMPAPTAVPTAVPTALPAPTITGITPSSGQNTTSISITNLAGTGFTSSLGGATVKLTKTGQTDIAATGVTVVSANQINCTIDLTGKATGQWNVVVTNPDAQSGTLANGFTVTSVSTSAPTVTGITPSSGQNTTSISITNLAGTGFLPGATVKLTKTGQSDIAATGVTVVSATQITCTFDLTGKIAGQWNVVVTNTDSQTGTFTNGFTVIAGITAPVASFTGTPTSGPAPLLVTFTDSSSGSPTSWSWNFGDGATSTVQNPTHTYSAAGNYTVVLTATNAGGSNNITRNNYIYVFSSKPLADFSGIPTTGAAPLAVTFTDRSTRSPTSWSWDFGDGTTSTVQNPSHTYATTGTYTVKLTTTNAGGSDILTQTNYITAFSSKPLAQFNFTPQYGTAPLAVTFTDRSTNSPTSWSWDFGDGTTSTVQNPSHTYATTGTYTINQTATNSGGSNTISRTLTVYATVPVNVTVADFTPTQVVFGTPTIVFASGSSTGASCWYWDFGDGTTSTEPNPTHTYAVPGTYTITLRTTSGTSCSVAATTGHTEITSTSSTTTMSVTVYALPPQAAFNATPQFGGIPLNVTFTDTTTRSPTNWSWDFGDGTTSTVQNLSHIYATTGTYTVKLTATNAVGSDTVTRNSYIMSYALAPQAYFTGIPTTGTAPLAVAFTDTSINGPTSWNWNFGDGSTNTTRNPVHTYTSTGIYTVALNATNSLGSNLFTRTNYVTVNSPAIISTVGVFRNGTVYLAGSNTNGGLPVNAFNYGMTGDKPITGKWTGTGIDTIGIFRNGMFYIRDTNTGGVANTKFNYGQAGDVPLAGHWSVTGNDTVGIFRNGLFALASSNINGGGVSNYFIYGQAGDVPVVGDWNGDGTTKVGIFRNGLFALASSNINGGGTPTYFIFGQAGDVPVTGDWNGDGKTEVGIFRNGMVYQASSNIGGGGNVNYFYYGMTGDLTAGGHFS